MSFRLTPASPSSHRARGLAAILAFALVVLASRRAHAGEESSWAFLGFSPDGGYAAVEVFGMHEGSDAPYSTIRIIDTKANQFVGAAITTCIGQGCEDPKNPNPTLKEARARNREKARPALAQCQIDVNIQGTRTSLSGKQRLVDEGAGGMARETAQLAWQDAIWTVVLQEVQAPSGADTGHGRPRMLDLGLQREGAGLILQKDKSIPKSRGAGIYAYELDSAITCRNALLIVLRYTRPGHDCAEITQMFVTAGSL